MVPFKSRAASLALGTPAVLKMMMFHNSKRNTKFIIEVFRSSLVNEILIFYFVDSMWYYYFFEGNMANRLFMAGIGFLLTVRVILRVG